MAKIPNWAFGNVSVKGNPKDVENFCKLFIFDEEAVGEKYFGRSFIHESWEDFKEEHLGGSEAEFNVEFAWSCWSCLFEGYPNGKECVTLEWAIKKYNVNIEINTEEEGMGFEEEVTTKNKKPIYESFEIPTYICQRCGNEQSIPSAYNSQDLEDVECYECGEYGKWEDELVEVVKEKMKMIENENDT